MNASNLSSVIRQSPQDIVGLLVMKKAMDTFKQDGQGMIGLLDSLPQNPPHLGQHIDIRA